MSGGILHAVVHLSHHHTVTRLHLWTWCLIDTVSKVTMLLLVLSGDIQLIWWRNGYATCLEHVKAHMSIFHEMVPCISPNWSRPAQFLAFACKGFHFPWLIMSDELQGSLREKSLWNTTIGWTLTWLTGIDQSRILLIGSESREHSSLARCALDQFIRSRYRNASWDLWNGTISLLNPKTVLDNSSSNYLFIHFRLTGLNLLIGAQRFTVLLEHHL